ncbi:MAG TPA: hypothetical protein VFH09_01570 [Nitrososphaera sp.]|nr:hypothetical protein [Nitrososphaera sp.]
MHKTILQLGLCSYIIFSHKFWNFSSSGGELKSQAAIPQAAGVSEVTLRKNQRMILGRQQQAAAVR